MKIHQLKITLKHIKPPIWRHLEVPADIKLGKLHDVIQIAMGWTDSHMHAFIAEETVYGTPDPEFGGSTKSERNVRLDSIVKAGGKLVYEYDFGDGWEHEIKIEKFLETDPATHYPRCTAGKRACPPEDSGGLYGYEEFLAANSIPKPSIRWRSIRRCGGCDRQSLNKRLSSCRRKSASGKLFKSTGKNELREPACLQPNRLMRARV